MGSSDLALPTNVSWQLIAASPDMMEQAGSTEPAIWRSSIAIYAYEPDDADLPDGLCDQKLTYLKISCSITGYQPTADEIKAHLADFSNAPPDAIIGAARDYWACYGMLLNVAVLGLSQDQKTDLGLYPHIVDFEPKTRDFYQVATTEGEVLTASVSDVKVDKSLAKTDSTETGLSVGTSYNSPPTPYGSGSVSANLSQKWGNTSADTTSVQSDGSRERREKQAVTTTLNQMYNLLTGYHGGTNRATFLMLPRPNTLQPTDFRTFVRGLRMIEGMQDFFLVVSRPKSVPGLCINVGMDTGHYPENPQMAQSGPYQSQTKQFEVTDAINNDGSDNVQRKVYTATFQIPDGYALDESQGDPAIYPGVQLVSKDDTSWDSYHWGIGPVDYTSDRTQDYITVNSDPVTLQGQTLTFTVDYQLNEDGDRALIDRTYNIFLKPAVANDKPTGTDLLITARELSVCFKSTGQCVDVLRPHRSPVVTGRPFLKPIVDEIPTAIPFKQGAGGMPQLDVKQFLRSLQTAMTSGSSSLTRKPLGKVGFFDTEYFKKLIKKRLPLEVRKKPLREVSGVPAKVAKALGARVTVDALFSADSWALAHTCGLEQEDIVAARRAALKRPAGRKR